MDTQQIVTTIKEDYAQDWSRPKILDMLDRVQKKLFLNDCAQTIFMNPSDTMFPIPLLVTTAGTLSYPVTGAVLVSSTGAAVTLAKNGYAIACRRVKRVFIALSNVSSFDSRHFYGDTFAWSGVNAEWTKSFRNVTFCEIPAILYDRTENESARIQFAEDPGSTNNKYYVEFYHTPAELTTESVPLSIDGDMWDEALIDGVVGLIEKSQYGKSEKWDMFNMVWKRRFIGQMNANEDRRSPKQIPIRECG